MHALRGPNAKVRLGMMLDKGEAGAAAGVPHVLPVALLGTPTLGAMPAHRGGAHSVWAAVGSAAGATQHGGENGQQLRHRGRGRPGAEARHVLWPY